MSGDARVVLGRHLRPDLDARRELERRAGLDLQLVDGGRRDRLDLVLLDGLPERVLDQVARDLVLDLAACTSARAGPAGTLPGRKPGSRTRGAGQS